MVKHTQTIRRLLLTNYLSVFDHFVGLVLKRLSHYQPMLHLYNLWFLGYRGRTLVEDELILFLQKNQQIRIFLSRSYITLSMSLFVGQLSDFHGIVNISIFLQFLI